MRPSLRLFALARRLHAAGDLDASGAVQRAATDVARIESSLCNLAAMARRVADARHDYSPAADLARLLVLEHLCAETLAAEQAAGLAREPLRVVRDDGGDASMPRRTGP